MVLSHRFSGIFQFLLPSNMKRGIGLPSAQGNLNSTLCGLKNNSNQSLTSFFFSLSVFEMHFVASYKGVKWKFGIS